MAYDANSYSREMASVCHAAQAALSARQLYCVRCREPKRPAFDEVDFIPKTPTTGLLAGLCPTCASMIYRVTKSASFAAAVGDLKVTGHPAQERLIDSSNPFPNVHFKGLSE
jgi:hypothetical protein